MFFQKNEGKEGNKIFMNIETRLLSMFIYKNDKEQSKSVDYLFSSLHV